MYYTSLLLWLFATFVVSSASSDGHGDGQDHGKDGQDHGKDGQGHGKDGDHGKGGGDGQHGHGVVKGKVFDRLITIWLENTDFNAAAADPNLKALAKQGLTLTNYFALTHPSEPNYVASVGGEFFGINNDDLLNLPTNVSSIVDLLEDKGISWAEYQEDMPSSGFTGFQFQNPKTQADDYVRKHNPLVIFESVNLNPRRLPNIKNFTVFERDLSANALPQWFFITPNMTNDGHDTDVTFSGNWARGFIEPLLKNRHFNDEKTLIILSFDENGSDVPQNRVFTIVLGNALPKQLVGKVDSNFYTHYSTIATAEANWGLHTLGRWDVGANVFEFVADKTKDKLNRVNINPIVLNASYPGIFNDGILAKQPVPNTRLVVNGRTVLPAIQKQWESQVHCTGYFGQVVPPSALTPPPIPHGC
ncbi:hypothetical protein DXG01_016845 [Tephrocybe rancida]|nr:hypothetical protein DXG01_016845 [Tephrocybe rancida]